jgi:hypothetical protein
MLNDAANPSEHLIVGIEPPKESALKHIWRVIRTPANANALTAIATVAYAVFTVFLVAVSTAQWFEIQGSKADTQRLLAALEKQAIALGVTANETKNQAQAAQRSARAAEDSQKTARQYFEQDQRAWVAPTSVVLSTLAEGQLISMIMTNTGKTPAFVTEVRVGAMVASGPLGTPRFWGVTTKPSKVVLPPNGTVSKYTKLDSLPKETIDLIVSGKATLYYFGRITYRDVFRDTPAHTTTFCTYYRPEDKLLNACDPKDGDTSAN